MRTRSEGDSTTYRISILRISLRSSAGSSKSLPNVSLVLICIFTTSDTGMISAVFFSLAEAIVIVEGAQDGSGEFVCERMFQKPLGADYSQMFHTRRFHYFSSFYTTRLAADSSKGNEISRRPWGHETSHYRFSRLLTTPHSVHWAALSGYVYPFVCFWV